MAAKKLASAHIVLYLPLVKFRKPQELERTVCEQLDEYFGDVDKEEHQH